MEKASGILAKFLLLLCLSLFGGIQRAEGVFTEERFCPHDTEQLHIPAGVFTMGSTSEEREYAYRLDKEVTRPYGWYEKEARKKAKTDGFCIDRYPITNDQYKIFVGETGDKEPYISPESYQQQGFLVHSYKKVKEFLWREGSFPGEEDGTEVSVTHRGRMGEGRAWHGWSYISLGERVEFGLPQ
jgi:formylglycine-generating enzyme required for sulfatase activity